MIKKIKIGHHTVDISTDREDLLEEYKSQGSVHGTFTIDTMKIVIDPDICDSMKKQILLHEVAHVLFFNTGLSDVVGDEQEESIIRAFVPALLAMMTENPKMMEFLTK